MIVPVIAYSQTVQTYVESNTNSTVEVNTTNSIQKKTEVTINGEKHVFESNEPGTDTIRVESNNGKTTISQTNGAQTQKIILPPTSTPLKITEVPIPNVLNGAKQTTLSNYIINWVKDFFKNLFN